jgi:hypothetical protein
MRCSSRPDLPANPAVCGRISMLARRAMSGPPASSPLTTCPETPRACPRGPPAGQSAVSRTQICHICLWIRHLAGQSIRTRRYYFWATRLSGTTSMDAFVLRAHVGRYRGPLGQTTDERTHGAYTEIARGRRSEDANSAASKQDLSRPSRRLFSELPKGACLQSLEVRNGPYAEAGAYPTRDRSSNLGGAG